MSKILKITALILVALAALSQAVKSVQGCIATVLVPVV